MRRAIAAIVWAIGVVMGGCATPLPTYAPMEPGEALAVMRARDSGIRSLQAECDLSLVDPSGSSVSFTAAIVVEWPDRLRLRAWKFGHAAFDLTYTPEGLWMYVPEEARKRAGASAKFDVTAEQFGRVWRMIGPRALDGGTISSATDHLFTVRKSLSGTDRGGLECDIDRTTLTVREFRFIDPEGQVRETLRLDSYRVSNPGSARVTWPGRIAAEGESGRITVRLIDPEFNGELPAAAFVPPSRAVKQP